jgi:hypothetical protein
MRLAPHSRWAFFWLCGLCWLSGCTPRYDWRTVHGNDSAFSVLLPSKPSVFTRLVNLGGITTNMTMTAAEIDHITFGVGSAKLADAKQAQAVLSLMKNTMVHNINGVISKESMQRIDSVLMIDIDAATVLTSAPPSGSRDINPLKSKAQRMRLRARFIARDERVYQVVVIGRDQAIPPEAVEMFLTSFKFD